MLQIFTIVCLLSLTVHSQSIPVREDVRPSRQYFYSDTAEDEARDTQQYKPIRRSERIPAYRYETEDNKPDVEYSYPIRYQSDQTENYPYTKSKDFEQILKSQYAQFRLPIKKQPIVEQYLKEVTPTTKTVYNQRPGNYLRLNTQNEGTKNREETPTRTILKQSPVRYVLQSDLQQKQPSQPQYQFEIPEASKTIQKPYEVQGHHPNLVAYQNTLLAHQKVLETDNNDDSSRSSIYVSHNIPKKPIRVKPPKGKFSEQQQYENIVPNLDYYSQLQHYHQDRQKQLQQLQQIQHSKPQVFEPSPAINYETPQPQKVESVYHVAAEDPSVYQASSPYQQIRQKPEKFRGQTRRPFKYQVEHPQFESPDAVFEYQKPEHLQYQKPGSKQHPKYLPEPKAVRYQATTLDEPDSLVNPQEEAFAKYQSAIQKYNQPPVKESHSPRYQQEVRYQAPAKYQFSEESQQVPQYKEIEATFERPSQNFRYRPSTRGPVISYRQNLQDSNVRYYRNLGRPYSYPGAE